MKRIRIRPHSALFSCFVVALATSVAAQTTLPTQNGEPKIGPNAALLYWQAFAVMPQLNDEQLNLLDLDADEKPTEKHRKLVQGHTLALKMLHRGSNIPRCNWDMQLEQDLLNVMLPHLSQTRQLVRAACLRARLRLADGNAKRAIDDLVAAMRLGRTLSNDPVIVCLMVDLWSEKMALDIIESHLRALDDEPGGERPAVRRGQDDVKALKKYLRMKLSSLPARTAFSSFVETDTHSMLETLEQAAKAADPQKFDADELNLGKDLKEVLTNCQEARKMAKRLVEIASQPDDETAHRLTDLEKQLKRSANPVNRLLTVRFGETYRYLVEHGQRLKRLHEQL